jgi:hypothetical protein
MFMGSWMVGFSRMGCRCMRTYPWSKLCRNHIARFSIKLILARVDVVKSNNWTSTWREVSEEDM